jgi:hypothetical protein
MSFKDELGADFAQILTYGTPVRMKYYTPAYAGAGSGYDDDVTLTQSGTDLWVSGIALPINTGTGPNSSYDAILIEQGKVLINDKKLYVAGSINTSGTFKVMVGSPTGREYSTISAGEIAWEMDGAVIYKKMYIRALTNGSLIGE